MRPIDARVDNPTDPKLQFSGAASAVAVDPQNPNNIYVLGTSVGVGGAIYRSTDQGKTWSVKRSLLDSYPPALDGSDPNGIYTHQVHPWDPVQCVLCIDTANPNYWYMGFFRSTDAGETWSRMIEPHIDYDLWGIAVDPGMSGLVYAAYGPDMRISHDYGATWAATTLGAHSGFVFVDPATGDVYGGAGKSTDNGQTWTRLSLAGNVDSVAFDPNGDVYFDGDGLFKSSDKGNTFHLQSPGKWSIYQQIVADPNASGHLFRFDRKGQVAGYTLSADAGQTFSSQVVSMPVPCILKLGQPRPDCYAFSTGPINFGDLTFTTAPRAQRQAPPAAAASAAGPAPAAPPPAPAEANSVGSGLRVVRAPDGTLYFVEFNRGWAIVPDPIDDSDLAGYSIAGQWLTIDLSQIQPGTVRMVVDGSGTVYVLQGTGGWSLLISPLSGAQAAGLQIGTPVNAVVQLEFLQNPTGFSDGTAAVTDSTGAPSTLTDAVRQDIINAINNYNAAWQQAKSAADASRLSSAAAGQELADDIAEVNQLRSQGHSQKVVQNSFNVTDITIDAPGHATVITTETWSGEIDSLTSGQLLQRLPPATYVETYTVEYLNGSWIVTLDQLRQV